MPLGPPKSGMPQEVEMPTPNTGGREPTQDMRYASSPTFEFKLPHVTRNQKHAFEPPGGVQQCKRNPFVPPRSTPPTMTKTMSKT
ncbi:hypothetical protein KC19_3G154600 [Ceratodon purpureus]|uniref:Uncharacterized protein n=1 Tax=Ceratodon purpureus TaxID=3225 RepID=A0A8T0IK87_CERPU|nr:hypothetical protein KC19_3G154600 [Ceratodon purpureus]